ncbi:type II 3-dehydroquinate dehydratase [Wohlfahrtiimonas chitiniclastica]|uniref:type II 3-dehydroquinate dehydratase n=1 Tax=Wohlfahrtiimonas chitiniclastica TaxID=400946 RepID=UPI000B983052|nr:type II 3-dehydroquinate dehydratase [Wohlfahrtiimonas chitiniclastica]OYQ75889.1 type II 3-dehydroquinate dehydratase [Wohlfahrtiimonas chitiniclastica]
MSTNEHSKVLLINGPNLNIIGTREPQIYGYTTLPELETQLTHKAGELQLALSCFQSNIEGEIINQIHKAKSENIDVILINPGAYTHTSIAIRDAFLSVDIPFIEIHISNVFAREPFRHHSYLSDIASGILVGHGLFGYELGLYRAKNIVSSRSSKT